MNVYYKILNEIASTFDMDQWDEQVNLFTDVISKHLNPFVHHTKEDWIYILENSSIHKFSRFDFYKEKCYVNGEKVELNNWGTIENRWWDQETVDVIIEDLDQLGEDCFRMFFDCFSLVSVPWFDTSGVKNMRSMFFCCLSLVSVPLFNISRVTDMYCIFFKCNSLSEKTKKEWSSIYDFKTDKMK